MSIRLVRGKCKNEFLDMTTSTVLAANSIVEITSGLVGAADDNDTALAGVNVKAIATTDADYALARKVPILVPVERHVVWEIDVESGDIAVAATHQGLEVGIVTAGTVDLDDTTNKVFLITEVVSTTKVRGYLKVNGSY